MRIRLRKRASYPRGVSAAGRRYAMRSQLALMEKALAPWPRRQAPLLEVNCGNGAFLPFLWQCGFDPQGSEIDPSLRGKAQTAKVPGLRIFAAADEDLPFDNDSFDWVILHLRTAESLKTSIAEGCRLARRGFMLTFWNSSSLPAFCWRFCGKKPWADAAVPWAAAWRQMRSLAGGRLATLSALLLPGNFWHDPWPANGFGICGHPLGAWCIIRLDMDNTRPVTPLPLRLDAPMPSQAEAVMEYSQKSSETMEQTCKSSHL